MRSKLSTLFFSTARKVAASFSGRRGGLACRACSMERTAQRPARRRPNRRRRAPRRHPISRPNSMRPISPASGNRAVYRTPPCPARGRCASPISSIATAPAAQGRPDAGRCCMGASRAPWILPWARACIAWRTESLLLVYPQQSLRGQRHRCWHWYQPDAAHGYAEADAIAGIARIAAQDYCAGPRPRLHRGPVGRRQHGRADGPAPSACFRRAWACIPARCWAARAAPPKACAPCGAGPPCHQRGRGAAAGDLMPCPGMPAIILQGERDAAWSTRAMARNCWRSWPGPTAWMQGGRRCAAGGGRRGPRRAPPPAHRRAGGAGRGRKPCAKCPGWDMPGAAATAARAFTRGRAPMLPGLMWRFFKARRRVLLMPMLSTRPPDPGRYSARLPGEFRQNGGYSPAALFHVRRHCPGLRFSGDTLQRPTARSGFLASIGVDTASF